MKFILVIITLCLAVRDGNLKKPAMDDMTFTLQRFAANLADTIERKNKNEKENIFFSPISISQALGMVMTGARGTTYENIKHYLMYNSQRQYHQYNVDNLFRKIGRKVFQSRNNPNRRDKATVRNANKVYVQESFEILSDYEAKLRGNFSAEVERIDFQEATVASERINSWVNNRTEGMIPDVIQPSDLNSYTRLVLVNALFFKAKWMKKLNSEGKRNFSNYDGDRRSIDFIGRDMHVQLLDGENYQTVFLQYKSNVDTYMVINMLPTAQDWGIFFQYNNLIKYFTKTILQKHKIRLRPAHVMMPKFDLEVSTDMKEVLISLGMNEMFDINHANFTGISTAEELYVSSFQHKAKISVNEAGTKAAAASTVIFLSRSAVARSRVIINRPFVFSIIRNNHVLFFGAVKDLK